jgi:ABC-type dipeptide/oligopeptide/nickel transport system ATPase subunit
MGKFDLQSEHIKERFTGNLSIENVEWQIGCIVGASGTGKTSIAKELFTNSYWQEKAHNSKSVLDDFSERSSVDEITKTFNAVGFSSPPSWLKPYEVLSNGEKMRVDLAQAILSDKDLIVFDEFTSVVDRNVAKIGSAAIAKSIRRTKKKFIAVSCNYDILEWLEPDWIFDTNEMRFKNVRGLLRRPEIELKIYERKGLWYLFRKYHYLNSELNNSSRQFIAFSNGVPIAFCAILHFPHPQVTNFKRISRVVTLPDYQGLGIGFRLMNFVCDKFVKEKQRVIITTTTPSLINAFKTSKHWQLRRTGMKSLDKTISGVSRFTTSWEYIQ